MAQDSAGGLESCLNLLRGNIDEQRLVGLLLATKLIKGEDSGAIVQIFNAMGVNFITRLLKSGTHGSKEEESYVQLAMSVFSVFCRVPELAASKEIIEMIPTLLEILRKWPEGNASADCLDCLLGIASASEQGINALRKSGVFPLLMDSLTRFKSDSESLYSAVKLVQIILAANVLEHDIICSSGNIISAIQNLANLLLHEQGSSKLDILLLFQRLFRSKILFQIQISSNSSWVTLMRNSIGHMLQSQSGIELKLLALDLTKSMVDIFSSSWLLGPMVLPGERKEMPVDRFFLLLVETLRVEVLVILNEVAHSRFNTESSMNSKSDEFMKRKYQLALVYSLLESVIELSLEEDDISRLSDTALQRTIPVLNDIMSTVIDFLEEAKRHSTVTGDDILASARFLSRFLADIPAVQRKFGEKLLSMLEYLFKVKSESEESPFLVIQFLLPAVCGITKEMKACESFVSWGGHKQVINFIHDVIRNNQVPSGLLINAGDIILNLLQKHRRLIEDFGVMDFLPLLSILPPWADSLNQQMEISMVASICALILDKTDEEEALEHTSRQVLHRVYRLILKVIEYLEMFETSLEDNNAEELWEITISACTSFVNRYPSFKGTLQALNKHSTNLLLQNLFYQARLTL